MSIGVIDDRSLSAISAENFFRSERYQVNVFILNPSAPLASKNSSIALWRIIFVGVFAGEEIDQIKHSSDEKYPDHDDKNRFPGIQQLETPVGCCDLSPPNLKQESVLIGKFRSAKPVFQEWV